MTELPTEARALAAAIRDALAVPEAAPGLAAAQERHLVVTCRATYVASALAVCDTTEDARRVLRLLGDAATVAPVTYPTRDEEDAR